MDNSGNLAADPADPDEHRREKREDELIKQLREEAYAVRDCFTRYSFQGVTASTAGLAIITALHVRDAYLGLLAVLPILLLFAVAGIGTHKYSTSNRLLGYELHLQRTRNYTLNKRWQPYMREIGWEEAMRAWRIVTPTLFEHVYTTMRRSKEGRDKARYYQKFTWRFKAEQIRELDKPLPAQRWFEPPTLLETDLAARATYYAGGYLQTMLNVVFVAVLASVVTMVIAVVQILRLEASAFAPMWRLQVDAESFWRVTSASLSAVLLLGAVVLSLLRYLHIRARLNILEQGMLSIHSCAIMWEATVLAHFRALDRLATKQGTRHGPGTPSQVRSYRGYTEQLGIQASEILRDVSDIHDWLDAADVQTTA